MSLCLFTAPVDCGVGAPSQSTIILSASEHAVKHNTVGISKIHENVSHLKQQKITTQYNFCPLPCKGVFCHPVSAVVVFLSPCFLLAACL